MDQSVTFYQLNWDNENINKITKEKKACYELFIPWKETLIDIKLSHKDLVAKFLKCWMKW